MDEDEEDEREEDEDEVSLVRRRRKSRKSSNERGDAHRRAPTTTSAAVKGVVRDHTWDRSNLGHRFPNLGDTNYADLTMSRPLRGWLHCPVFSDPILIYNNKSEWFRRASENVLVDDVHVGAVLFDVFTLHSVESRLRTTSL